MRAFCQADPLKQFTLSPNPKGESPGKEMNAAVKSNRIVAAQLFTS